MRPSALRMWRKAHPAKEGRGRRTPPCGKPCRPRAGEGQQDAVGEEKLRVPGFAKGAGSRPAAGFAAFF